jgi:hypothetical protein
MSKILIEAVGDYSPGYLGSQFVLDGTLYNYVKKTNTYVNSKFQSLYEDSDFDSTIFDEPYPEDSLFTESGSR